MRSQLFSLATLVFVGAVALFGHANQAHALTLRADSYERPSEYILADKSPKKDDDDDEEKCEKKDKKKKRKISRYDLNGDGEETSGEIFEGTIDEVNSVLQDVLNATKNDPVIKSEFDK